MKAQRLIKEISNFMFYINSTNFSESVVIDPYYQLSLLLLLILINYKQFLKSI